MAFSVDKEFMVVTVSELTSKKGVKFNIISLLDWESGTTTEFMDFDQKYSGLTQRQNVNVKMKIDNGKDGWKVYLNDLSPVISDVETE